MKAVNLIPGERRRKSRDVVGRSGGGALGVLVLVAGLAVLAVMYGSARHQISNQAGKVASLTAQTNAVEARTGRLSSYSSFVAMAESRMQTVSQLVESRFDWSHALHELGRVLPADTSLDSLHGAVGSGEEVVTASRSSSSSSASGSATSTNANSSTPPGSTPVFTLSGCATSQSEVAQTLQRLRLMNGVSEVQLQSSTSSGSSSGAGTSSGGGGCTGSDPSFTVQVSFAALPAAPALSAPAGVTPAAAHGHGVKEQISARGKAAPR